MVFDGNRGLYNGYQEGLAGLGLLPGGEFTVEKESHNDNDDEEEEEENDDNGANDPNDGNCPVRKNTRASPQH